MSGKIITYTNNAKLSKYTCGIKYIEFIFINIKKNVNFGSFQRLQ